MLFKIKPSQKVVFYKYPYPTKQNQKTLKTKQKQPPPQKKTTNQQQQKDTNKFITKQNTKQNKQMNPIVIIKTKSRKE